MVSTRRSMEIIANMIVPIIVWKGLLAWKRLRRFRVGGRDERLAQEVIDLLDNQRDTFEDTLDVLNPFRPQPVVALGRGGADVSGGGGPIVAGPQNMVRTPVSEMVRAPQSPTRSAVALAHAVKVKMGTTPSMSVANKMVASKLAFCIAKAHNVRDADMCMLVPMAVSLVFLPSQHDVEARRTFMTRTVSDRHDEHDHWYGESVWGRVLARLTGETPVHARSFSAK
jgi:hypothetical protein